MRLGLLVLSGAEEVAGIDRRGGELRGAAGVRTVPRTPGVAGIGSIPLGRRIAQLLEGVAPIAEVAGALDDPLQLPGVDFGPVLRALQLFQLRREPVDGAVQSHGLHVQGVDEPPEQRFPFIGELGAVGRDLIDEGVEDRFQARQRLVAIPDGSWIGLALLRRSSEALEVLADHGGTLQSSGEIGDGLRDALTAFAEAPRTDRLLEQLDALRTLVNHLKGLPDRTAAGVQDAVITLLEDTWRYSFQRYFSIKRGGDAEVETYTSVR